VIESVDITRRLLSGFVSREASNHALAFPDFDCLVLGLCLKQAQPFKMTSASSAHSKVCTAWILSPLMK